MTKNKIIINNNNNTQYLRLDIKHIESYIVEHHMYDEPYHEFIIHTFFVSDFIIKLKLDYNHSLNDKIRSLLAGETDMSIAVEEYEELEIKNLTIFEDCEICNAHY
jgi:hypothetical protein